MLQSMTAFSRTQSQGEWGSLVCEIRSINHRYLDVSLRMPDVLNVIESTMRERIQHYIQRGKIECFLRYHSSEAKGTDFTINATLAKKICEANKDISKFLTNPALINPMDILRWPGMMQIAEISVESIQHEVLQLLEKSLQALVQTRCREGESLKVLFKQRLDEMKAELVKVRHRIPNIIQGQRDRLLAHFTEASLQLDSNRLEQELVLLAQKIDVTEEIDRLETHIHEVERILKDGGVAGRRLDFLMQELNREANTLGSKSVDADTTLAAVELKVLIEQVREQVQNIE